MKINVGRFEWSLHLPKVGRKRAILTYTLATVYTVLWFWALLKGLAGMRPSMRTVVAGIAIPWGWAWSMLMFAESRIKRDLRPADRRNAPHPSARLGQAQVHLAERQAGGPVLEGEVLPR
jgi:hypothetical protein